MCMGGGGGGEIKETADQKELAEIGLQQFDRYMSMYPDIENQYFNDIEKLNTSESYQRGADVATTNVGSAYSQARDDLQTDMTSAGVNPNSGGFKQAIASTGTSEGVDRLQNVGRTQQAIQDSYLGGKAGIVAMGQGQEAQAVQGFGNIARASGQEAADDAFRDYNRSANRRSAIATGVGVGLGAYDGYQENKDD